MTTKHEMKTWFESSTNKAKKGTWKSWFKLRVFFLLIAHLQFFSVDITQQCYFMPFQYSEGAWYQIKRQYSYLLKFYSKASHLVSESYYEVRIGWSWQIWFLFFKVESLFSYKGFNPYISMDIRKHCEGNENRMLFTFYMFSRQHLLLKF